MGHSKFMVVMALAIFQKYEKEESRDLSLLNILARL